MFFHTSANHFNDFVYLVGLAEVDVKGRRFTRVSTDGAKVARLDRFLVSDGLIDQFPNLVTLTL